MSMSVVAIQHKVEIFEPVFEKLFGIANENKRRELFLLHALLNIGKEYESITFVYRRNSFLHKMTMTVVAIQHKGEIFETVFEKLFEPNQHKQKARKC